MKLSFITYFAGADFSFVSEDAVVLLLETTLRCGLGLAGVACNLVSVFTSFTSLTSGGTDFTLCEAAAGSSFLPFISLAFGFSLQLFATVLNV